MMVADNPRENNGELGQNEVLDKEGENKNPPSSADSVVDVSDMGNVDVSGRSGELPICPLDDKVVLKSVTDSRHQSICDKNDMRQSGAMYDQSAHCNSRSDVSHQDDIMDDDILPSSDDKSDSASTSTGSYDDSDYTDTVGSSAGSDNCLLPIKTRKHHLCGRSISVLNRSEPNLSKTDSDDGSNISDSNTVITTSDCYENKDYTDTIFSNASSTRPLLRKTDSLWSFVKEVEVSTPVIGLIDHPGFMSSQRDLSSNSNLSFACQKALQFLQDERVVSSLLLSGSKKDISIQSIDIQSDIVKKSNNIDHNIVPSGRHTRNLISLTACITMVFIACGSLRNLQTSINHEGGVGVTGLAANFLGYVIGSIFSPFAVQNFHPYRSLLASLLPHALYIAANFYPVMWLMVPVSFLWGVSGAILWNAMSTYITFLAKGYSEKKKLEYEVILSRFFGIFYLVWQLYMIFGNLIASLILTYAYPVTSVSAIISPSNSNIINETLNTELMYSLSGAEAVITNSTSLSAFNATLSHYSLCGARYCHHYPINNTGTSVSIYAKYVLYGTYMGFMMVAVIIAVFFLEPLNNRLFSSAVMKCNVVKTQVVSLGQFVTNRKFLLLCPLLLFSQTQAAFANGEITKAFVTCPVGVHMVGYTMICMGMAGSGSAYLSSWFSRFLGRTVLIVTAAVLNVGLLAFMAVWHPTPDSLIIIFALFGLWGIADGIWMAQSNCLMGVLFRDKFEEAFTGLRIMQGLGPAIIFAIAQSLCMTSKIYIMGTMCVLAMVGYSVSEYLLKQELKQQHVPVFDATDKV